MSEGPEPARGPKSSRGAEKKDGEGKPPRPVRPSGPGADVRRPKQRKGAGGKKKKPTPVRDLASTEIPSSPTEPDLEETRITVGEATWIVRVLGRAGAASASATPLLLLGFSRDEEGGDSPERETLVVGRTLASQTAPALRRAFEASEEYRPPSVARSERGRRTGNGGRRRRSGRGS